MIWATEKEGTVEPQILAHLANFVPIAPGLGRRRDRRHQIHGLNERSEGGGIRRGKLQPTAHRILIDADRASQGSG